MHAPTSQEVEDPHLSSRHDSELHTHSNAAWSMSSQFSNHVGGVCHLTGVNAKAAAVHTLYQAAHLVFQLALQMAAREWRRTYTPRPHGGSTTSLQLLLLAK